MRIPHSLLKEWARLKSAGDAQKIAEMAGCSPMTVYRAFREEVCNDNVLEAIAAYYKEKKERIDILISDYEN